MRGSEREHKQEGERETDRQSDVERRPEGEGSRREGDGGGRGQCEEEWLAPHAESPVTAGEQPVPACVCDLLFAGGAAGGRVIRCLVLLQVPWKNRRQAFILCFVCAQAEHRDQEGRPCAASEGIPVGSQSSQV